MSSGVRLFVSGFFGDEASARLLTATCEARLASAVAVVMDIGDGTSLAASRDAALAAGAMRCHALDLREEFLRQSVLPAVRTTGERLCASRLNELGAAFLRDQLQQIAAIEQTDWVMPTYSGVPFVPGRPLVRFPAAIDIAFGDGVPTAINDVAMPIVELVECLQTIAGGSGLDVLATAYRTLDGASSGLVSLQIVEGGTALAAPTPVVR